MISTVLNGMNEYVTQFQLGDIQEKYRRDLLKLSNGPLPYKEHSVGSRPRSRLEISSLSSVT